MAGSLDQLRGLLIEQARRRPSEFRWHKDGTPYAADLARKMGLSTATVSRVLRGKMHRRDGVLRPRRGEYQISHELLQGLMRLLGMASEADARSLIESFRPEPPFPTHRQVH